MRILIVNGYKKGADGLKKFSEFQYAIMKILSEQKELVDTETEYFLRDRDNLDDFLYEIETSNLKREAGNNFDQLDMIFITGDANVRPWSKSMKKIITLLRMSLKVKKFLFACSWAMQAIVYLCASDLEKEINIINGNGNGGKIQDIHQYFENWQNYKQNDYFLDNTTGDLYGYNPQQNEWVPKSQVGLHYRRSAMEFQQIGSHMIKPHVVSSVQTQNSNSNLYKSRQYEDTCKIRKIYLQHWAFQDSRSEFIVPLKNSWDSHNVIFPNEMKKYKILAESDQRGPLIIELENTLCTMFSVNQKYEMTLIPMRNFVIMALKSIKSVNQMSQNNAFISITEIHNLMKKNQFAQQFNQNNNNSAKVPKALQILQERTKNIGFSKSLRNINSPNSFNIHKTNNAKDSTISQQKFTNFNTLQDQVAHTNESFNQKLPQNFSPIRFRNDTQNNSAQVHKRANQEQRLNTEPNMGNFFNSAFASPKINNFNKNDQDVIENNGQQNNQKLMEQYQGMTPGEIRGFLHPRINNEFIKKEPLWVPGQFSQSKNKTNRKIVRQNPPDYYCQTNQDSFTTQKRNNSESNFIQNRRLHTSQKQRYLPTQPSDYQYSSIFKDDPYQTQNDVMKKLQQIEDQKIIGSKKFKVTKGKDDQFTYIAPETAYPLNFSKHKYRDEKRDQWLSQQFKNY